MFPFPYAFWAPILLPVIASGQHRKLFPYDLQGPLKQTLMTLFRLAWSSKVQLPLLITVIFMTFDIQLQVEINIIWEANRREAEPEPMPDLEEQRLRRHLIRQLHAAQQAQNAAPLARQEESDDDDDLSTEDGTSSDDDSDSDTSALSSLPSDPDTRSSGFQSHKKDDGENGDSAWPSGDSARSSLRFQGSGDRGTRAGGNEPRTSTGSEQKHGRQHSTQLAKDASSKSLSRKRSAFQFVPLWNALRRVLEFQKEVSSTSPTRSVAKGLLAQTSSRQSIHLPPR